MNPIDLDKLAKKRQYKMRGVLEQIQWVNDSIAKVFVSKGTGSKKKMFIFTVLRAKGIEINALQPKYRMKIWFTIKCQPYKESWFTNLILESFEYWSVNDDKIKKVAAINKRVQDAEYTKSIQTEFDSKEFLNDGFDNNLISK